MEPEDEEFSIEKSVATPSVEPSVQQDPEETGKAVVSADNGTPTAPEESSASVPAGTSNKKKKKLKKHKNKHRKERDENETTETSAEAKARRKARKEKKRLKKEKKRLKRDREQQEQYETSQKDEDSALQEDNDPSSSAIEVADEHRNNKADNARQNATSYFDQVLTNMRNRKRRRQKISELELQEFVGDVLQKMRMATEHDAECFKAGKPATGKLLLLDQCVAEISKPKFVNWFIQEGVCSVLAEWLAPVDDESLPSFTIRSRILHLLLRMPIETSDLASSDLGRCLVTMWGHPDETDQNRKMIRTLISRWTRPLLSANRGLRDEDYMPLRQLEADSAGGRSSTKRTGIDLAAIEPEEHASRKRAVPPGPVAHNFVLHPKSSGNRFPVSGGNFKTMKSDEKKSLSNNPIPRKSFRMTN